MQAKRVVWPDVIVFFMPDVDRNLGLFDAVEPLGIEALLTQDTVEAFVIAILARALRCLSHRPLLSDYDEPETLS